MNNLLISYKNLSNPIKISKFLCQCSIYPHTSRPALRLSGGTPVAGFKPSSTVLRSTKSCLLRVVTGSGDLKGVTPLYSKGA